MDRSTRMGLRGLVVVAALGVAPACARSAAPTTTTHVGRQTHVPSAARSGPKVVSGIALLPLIRSERDACARLARAKVVPVLCPTVLPRPTTTYPATPIGVHTFDLCAALSKRADCPLYDFAVLYGAPDESPLGGPHNTPASFLHFEMLGGTYVGDALGVRGLAGTVPLQRLIGHRTIAGHHGLLYFGLPYQHGGGQYGSHYTFVWNDGRWRYAASLHSWTPHAATLRVLAALIAGLAGAPA